MEDNSTLLRLTGTMKTAMTILLIVLCCVPSVAHPGTAFVIDNENNVYFAYWGGTWKLDQKGHLQRIHSNDFHFLAIDMTSRFVNMKLPDILRITPDGSMPALFSFPEYPATFHTDGSLYVAPWSIGRIRLERIKPDGSKSVFVDATIDSRLARKPGRHEGGVLAIPRVPMVFCLFPTEHRSGQSTRVESFLRWLRILSFPVARRICQPSCQSPTFGVWQWTLRRCLCCRYRLPSGAKDYCSRPDHACLTLGKPMVAGRRRSRKRRPLCHGV